MRITSIIFALYCSCLFSNTALVAQQKDKVVQFTGYRTSHIASDHQLTKFSKNGDLVLEDGSNWKVNPDDLASLKDWNRSDAILVLQNGSNTLYPYILSNETSGSSVAVQVTGYSGDGLYAQQIESIWTDEKGKSWLKLRDGAKRSSTWLLPQKKIAVWSRWKLDEYVLVGNNNVCQAKICLRISSPNILVNLSNRRRDFVASTCVK